MFLEFISLMSGKLELDTTNIENSIIGLVAILALLGAGFAVKGVWGSLGALALGILGYLLWQNL